MPASLQKPSQQAIRKISFEDESAETDLTLWLRRLERDRSILAIDLETKGTLAHHTDTEIVGVGLASHRSILYIHLGTAPSAVRTLLYKWLQVHSLEPRFPGFIAHNLFFDGTVLLAKLGVWLKYKACTYGLFKQLANEGFPGQLWGLKYAQTTLLGWEDTNEGQLDRWLVKEGYYKGQKRKDDTGPEARLRLHKAGALSPDKSQMYRAPAEILGLYCALDAASTYMLYADVIQPSVEQRLPKTAQDGFWDYHERLFLSSVRQLAYQQLSGIELNVSGIESYVKELRPAIKKLRQDFCQDEEAVEHVERYRQMKLGELCSKKPPRYKKQKPPPKEPKHLKRDGSVSKAWRRWEERYKEWQNTPAEETASWQVFQKKLQQLKDDPFPLNLDSVKQKRWLFYDSLKFPVILTTDNGDPAVDKKALKGFGRLGGMLKKQNDLTKELSYVESALAVSHEGRIHPQFRVPGTLTCRLAGSGGWNVQQQPKTRGYLENFKPRPGTVWIDRDVTSLEQVVLAELSRDPVLWELYGPAARKGNDVYLFNGSRLPIIGDEIRRAGYDPDNWTADTVSEAKKKAKKARSVSKIITLGSSYGMGPSKLKMTLNLEGIHVSDEEAYAMWSGYWDLYKGIKQFESELVKEWKLRGGWIYNGYGRPVGVHQESIKDIVNRSVQSTGHDVLMVINYWIERLMTEAGFRLSLSPTETGPKLFRGIIWDFHDETLLEVNEEDADEVVEIFKAAYARANEELQGVIPITGDSIICRSLADAKLEE